MIHHYLVITPEYESSYSDDEPPEIGCDVVTIWADNLRTAKILAIRTKEFRGWVRLQREDESSPFTGLKVQPGKCSHGKCACDVCQEECEKCIEEADCIEELRTQKKA